MSAIFKSCLVQNTCNIVMHRVQDKWEENITTYIHLIPLSVSFPKLSNFCFGWLVVKWCGKEVQIVKRVKLIWVHNHKLRENTSSKNLPSKQAKALFEWRISKKRLKWTRKIIRTRGSSLVQLQWTNETIKTWRTSLVHQ